MKKELLALAVAGAVIAPSAMAGPATVTFYGQINAAIVATDSGDVPGSQQGTTATHIASEQSRIGFKGTEDLGGGTSAIWQIESSINADGANGTLANRNTFVGLAGESWGDIKLGNMDSSYKSATRGFDLFADTVADNRSIMGVIGQTNFSLDARNTSSLTYTSPDKCNFKVSAQYVAAAETATTSPTNKGSNYSLSLVYNADSITAAAAVVQMKAGAAGTGTANLATTATTTTWPYATATGAAADDKIRGLRLGGAYKKDAISVNAMFERVDGDITTTGNPRGNSLRANTFYLGGKFSLSSSDAVKLAYTYRGEIGKTSKLLNSQVSQWSLGYDHAMSKRTQVYALYTRLNNNNNSSQSFASISTAAPTASGSGADPAAVALGVKHSF
ncbi:MAG: porin [Gallionellaceae bacterium]|nr:porin [Gallionellaceae bacterium]